MAWLWLTAAGIFEVVWATALKFSRGFTEWKAATVTVAAMFISFGLLAQAMKTLPLGTAYAVWTGIGAAGTVLVGIFLFKEPVTVQRIVFLLFRLHFVFGKTGELPQLVQTAD